MNISTSSNGNVPFDVKNETIDNICRVVAVTSSPSVTSPTVSAQTPQPPAYKPPVMSLSGYLRGAVGRSLFGLFSLL